MQSVDILLIDANKLFREGLKRLLDGSPFAIAAEADNLVEGMTKIEHGLQPKVALVEFDTGNDDVVMLHTIREKFPDLKLVVLAATTRNIHHLARCFEAGADAYLLKNISPDALKQSLKVLLGEKVFPTKLAALLVSGQIDTQKPAAASADLEGLSEREVQILRCLLNGHPNKVIAKKLNITEATVKVHLKGVLKKINAANRTQAAIWALNNGLSSESPLPTRSRRSQTGMEMGQGV
ncbi:MAG: response regulator transcription factor [Rhodospirillales bacterium]|nr:response regulator transcription factor [Rhodospirillales bacterium]